jgi:hypothetical protein
VCEVFKKKITDNMLLDNNVLSVNMIKRYQL